MDPEGNAVAIIDGVTTLSFQLNEDEELLRNQISTARHATLSQLEKKITKRLKGRGVTTALGWLRDDKVTQLIGIKKDEFLARRDTLT